MKLTFRDILSSKAAVEQLLRLSPAPTGRVAYAIARNARKLNGVLEDYRVAYQAISDEYVVDDDGERRIDGERRAAFEAELDDLLDQAVDVDVRIIGEADLLACDEKRSGFSIPPSAIFDAWFMFEGDDDDQPTA